MMRNKQAWIWIAMLLGVVACNPRSTDEQTGSHLDSTMPLVDGLPFSVLLTGEVQQVWVLDKSWMDLPDETNKIESGVTEPIRAVMIDFKRSDGSVFSCGTVGTEGDEDLRIAEQFRKGQAYIIPDDVIQMRQSLRESEQGRSRQTGKKDE